MGLLLGCCFSTFILCINITLLIVIASRDGGFNRGFAVPMTGIAEDVSRWSSGIHIAINLLSTILLSASNYTMQILSSPTRHEIDEAHERDEYMDVGFLSTKNLRKIPRRRLSLFILMAISSIPIHLL